MFNRSSFASFLSSQGTRSSLAVPILGAWQSRPKEGHSLAFQDDTPVATGPGSLATFQAARNISHHIEDHRASPSALSTGCSICRRAFTFPKVLSCLHTVCKLCLEEHQTSSNRVKCPQCLRETTLPAQGIAGLLSHYAFSSILETVALDRSFLTCTACKSTDVPAVARCLDCVHYLCNNCAKVHQIKCWFQDHSVLTLGEIPIYPEGLKDDSDSCARHKNERLQFICRTCDVHICRLCVIFDHPTGMHDLVAVADVGRKLIDDLPFLISNINTKTNSLLCSVATIETTFSRLQFHCSKVQSYISSSSDAHDTTVGQSEKEILTELYNAYNRKLVFVERLGNKVHENLCKAIKISAIAERLENFSSTNTELLAFKQLLDTEFQNILSFNPEQHLEAMDLLCVPNIAALPVVIQNSFGCAQQPFEATPQRTFLQPFIELGGCSSSNVPPIPDSRGNSNSALNASIVEESAFYCQPNCSSNTAQTSMKPLVGYKCPTTEPRRSFLAQPRVTDPCLNPCSSSLGSIIHNKTPIRRQKMVYHCKFGDFGVLPGLFTEPSGVAVNAQGDIMIADTNRHSIQVLDRQGRLKLRFGEWGQLHYPNRVSVVRALGDIIVTERSPTHQVQVFNQYGRFLRKFGSTVLRYPRAVTVDNKCRIIVVESKIMRVVIFDLWGNIVHQFSCDRHLEFPNSVAVNDKREVFISDNRNHCVKVFSYEGAFLRLIGGPGLTNYPIAVSINHDGHLLVFDNRNHFHITIFTQEGQLISAFESHMTHVECYDVALMQDNSVVLASKDCKLYVYRYEGPRAGI